MNVQLPAQLLSMLQADPPYSYAEISARLNIPVGSIGPQRGRCLERLRKSYAFLAEGWEKPSPAFKAAGQAHEDPPADRRPWGGAMPRGPQ